MLPARIRNGMAVNLPEMSRAPLVKVFAGQTELVCIAGRVAGTLFHPKVVLAAGDRVIARGGQRVIANVR